MSHLENILNLTHSALEKKSVPGSHFLCTHSPPEMQKAGFSSINCSFKRKCLLRTANLLYSLMKSMKQRLLQVVGQHPGEGVGER